MFAINSEFFKFFKFPGRGASFLVPGGAKGEEMTPGPGPLFWPGVSPRSRGVGGMNRG